MNLPASAAARAERHCCVSRGSHNYRLGMGGSSSSLSVMLYILASQLEYKCRIKVKQIDCMCVFLSDFVKPHRKHTCTNFDYTKYF